ncbi:nucleotidyltransferase domain-containing protein [Corallococcus sp. CA047B]|uniref:nucleotidyltransferase domain-containing protein n=1 Tax=Corallococcus sp. CA047B TaxID=2316729 RepID=UPI000EA3E758|nr:nucleotidyltransferase domain-containing protein [Corallococcus sp. CA047B]RKH19441.1 nucleotidyltransferase domain-containing protein [Corallococcus sp. CA047B]
MDEEVTLVGLTEDMQVNAVLFGFVGLYAMMFPGRVAACYLVGSHATSEAVGESDLDLTLVFKDTFLPGEEARFERFRTALGPLSRHPLDLNAVEEARLVAEGEVNLKENALLIAGEDLRERIPLMPLEAWTRHCMHQPYRFIERARARAEDAPLRFPLEYPDARGELYGYDYREVMDANGVLHRGFKELVTLACRMATAAVAVDAGRHTFSKRDAIQAHREHLHDTWTPLYESIFASRQQWGYRVPEDAAARATLRAACARMLDAENAFLARYRDYLLAELTRGRLSDRVLAARRLGDIAYPDAEVPEALQRLLEDAEPALREVARESLDRLARHRGDRASSAA